MTNALGFRIEPAGSGQLVNDLVQPGLRRNPRRAHLLVSTVLGKHIPTDPATVIAAGHRLGALVAGSFSGTADVMGMAETATALGHCVADSLAAGLYIHTTRRRIAGFRPYVSFEEGHSHATTHTLLPSRPELLEYVRPLVVVDDEISTGATAIAAIRALHRRCARPRYVVASLVDLREGDRREVMAAVARELGTEIDAVSLATGEVMLPDKLVEAVQALPPPALNPIARDRGGSRQRVRLDWPVAVPTGGTHGFLDSDHPRFEAAVQTAADRLLGHLDTSRPVLVVGHEEFMYLPLRVAERLGAQGVRVLFQSTTRSPAYVMDIPGYPLRRGYRFSACEPDEPASRFLYNGWPAEESDAGPQVVLIIEASADTGRLAEPGGFEEALASAGHDVLVAVVHGTGDR